MGDMGDVFKKMRKGVKEINAGRKKRSTEGLFKSEIPYKSANNGECLMIRSGNYPCADFYPSTGKWKVGKEIFSGGYVEFLKYMESHRSVL